jgi:hypothetical protein
VLSLSRLLLLQDSFSRFRPGSMDRRHMSCFGCLWAIKIAFWISIPMFTLESEFGGMKPVPTTTPLKLQKTHLFHIRSITQSPDSQLKH